MNSKRFFVVLIITAALTATLAATSVSGGENNKAYVDLPPQAAGHASDQGAVHSEAPSQAGAVAAFDPPPNFFYHFSSYSLSSP